MEVLCLSLFVYLVGVVLTLIIKDLVILAAESVEVETLDTTQKKVFLLKIIKFRVDIV